MKSIFKITSLLLLASLASAQVCLAKSNIFTAANIHGKYKTINASGTKLTIVAIADSYTGETHCSGVRFLPAINVGDTIAAASSQTITGYGLDNKYKSCTVTLQDTNGNRIGLVFDLALSWPSPKVQEYADSDKPLYATLTSGISEDHFSSTVQIYRNAEVK